MYVLDACTNPGLLRALYFVTLCMDVIFTIVPIGLILMLTIDFGKAVLASDADAAKKDTKLVGKRIISAIILFAIPWIVDIFMYSMGEIGFATDFTTCITRARTGDFKKYDKLYDEEQKKLQDEWQKKIAARAAERANNAAKNELNSKSDLSSNTNVGGLPIPVYYQSDYSDVYLASGKTVASSGCGFTSSSMIVSYLTGKKITPKEFVGDWSKKYYVPGVGMSWSLPNAAAEHYNLGSVQQTSNINEAYNALKEGHPVMSAQSAGLFTSGGHLIVLRGVDENGKILVNDPNKHNAVDKGYNNRAFSKNEIYAAGTQYFIWPKK